MGGALGCVSPAPQTGQAHRKRTSFLSVATNSTTVAVGQKIYFRVGYQTKDDMYWMWEEALVEDITGSIIRITLGMSNNAECLQVDCGTDDLFKLATRDMLSGPRQLQEGGPLTEGQREACCSYFDLTRGVKPAVAPTRHEDLPVRAAEGLLDTAAVKPNLSGIQPVDNTTALLNRVVLCRDRFKSKNSGEMVHKWREAQITEVQGTNVKVHFTGWSENHDIWKDLQSSAVLDLAPPDGVIDRRQGLSGGPLSEPQQAATLQYLRDGVVPVVDVAVAIDAGRFDRRGSGSGRLHHSFVAGQQVEVQEAGRHGTVITGRWRPAVISKMRGDVLRIHFIGFDSSWDEEIDMGEHPGRVRVVGKDSEEAPLQLKEEPDLGLGMGDASTPEQRRRKTSRRASFDPSQLESYNSGKGNSQKIKVNVEPSISTMQRGSFNGTSHSSGSQIKIVETANKISGKDENTELDGDASAIVMWNTGSRKSSSQRGKNTHQRTQTFPDPENKMIAIERYFFNAMANNGYHVIEVESDGNCLFRAVAHQIWLDESRHGELRSACVQHMRKHRNRYEVFCPMDYDEYLNHMIMSGTWADDFEIRALEEMLDRLVSIYSSDNKDIRPINKNFDEEYKLGRHVRPIILSYHGGNHYNSVFDERSPLPLGPRDSHTILDMRTEKIN